jgi:hypothetical protein
VRSNAQPGVYTIVFRGQAQGPVANPRGGNRNAALVQPANPVTITVLPQALATVTLAPNSVTLKPGQESAVTVRVKRLGDYRGAFKVQLIQPANMTGVEAEEVTIPEGKDEARFVLRAKPDAPAGNRPNTVIRAIATFKDKPVTQETKLNLTVNP